MDRKEFFKKSLGLIALGGLSIAGFAAEQTEKEKKYKVIANRCDGCSRCFGSCKDKALMTKLGKAVIDQHKCKGCGECTRFCRRMAIVEQE